MRRLGPNVCNVRFRKLQPPAIVTYGLQANLIFPSPSQGRDPNHLELKLALAVLHHNSVSNFQFFMDSTQARSIRSYVECVSKFIDVVIGLVAPMNAYRQDHFDSLLTALPNNCFQDLPSATNFYNEVDGT